ncbi:hypothetical protein ES703_27859 [subsurface metagenome]
MKSVSISSKYQVVIPKDIREKYSLKPGERMVMIPYEGRIEMVLERNIKDMRGFLKGINTIIQREDTNRI